MLPTTLRRTGTITPFDWMDREFTRALNRLWTEEDGGRATGIYPVDVHEDSDHLYIAAELPGFKKEEVHVTLERGVISINAERKAEEAKGEPHLNERRFTRVSRSFTLPVEVDENRVEAKLTDGVLHLRLNKREEVKPRRIEVQTT